MSIHFLLDGYNLIRSSRWLESGSIDEQRRRLIRFIEDDRPAGRNPVTVVFDGRPGRNPCPGTAAVTVVFSFDRSADTVIKERVDAARNARDFVVVTNDRAIQKWVGGAHAKVLSCAEFLGRRTKSPVRPAKLDPQSAAAINEELRQLWLGGDEGQRPGKSKRG